jgi:hypothetical protein
MMPIANKVDPRSRSLRKSLCRNIDSEINTIDCYPQPHNCSCPSHERESIASMASLWSRRTKQLIVRGVYEPALLRISIVRGGRILLDQACPVVFLS